MVGDEGELDRAFSVETPEENRRLYAAWAADYDDGFLDSHGYVHHRSVADAFVARPRPGGAVLDVGCGTGAVGIALCDRGVEVADGIDLSPEMLAVAATKRTADGDPVYRRLTEADLTVPLELGDGSYAGVVSAGAFTHGHLGPEPLHELVRVAVAGARFAIGVNADHYETAGFADWFDRAEASGAIRDLEILDAPVYDQSRFRVVGAAEHASTRSSIAVFTRDQSCWTAGGPASG